MWPGAARSIMLPMTRAAASSKVLLVKDRRCEQAEPGAAVVRRYRLARLRLDGRPAGADSPYEHLKRVYD
jgi:hypothetical protein